MSYSSRLYDLAQMNQISYILSILYNKVGNLKKRDEAANLFLLTQKEIRTRESQTQFIENEILEPQMLIQQEKQELNNLQSAMQDLVVELSSQFH
jgi:uncharacterized protein (DUF342 family)